MMPGQNKRRTQTIEALGQIVVADDLNEQAVDAIVRHQSRYGFINADDVSASRTRKKTEWLCYSLQGPISAAKIETLLRGNVAILDANGEAMRQAAAIASNDAIVKTVSRQSEIHGLKVDVSKLDVTIQQDVGGKDQMSAKDAVAAGYKVGPEVAVIKRGRKGK